MSSVRAILWYSIAFGLPLSALVIYLLFDSHNNFATALGSGIILLVWLLFFIFPSIAFWTGFFMEKYAQSKTNYAPSLWTGKVYATTWVVLAISAVIILAVVNGGFSEFDLSFFIVLIIVTSIYSVLGPLGAIITNKSG